MIPAWAWPAIYWILFMAPLLKWWIKEVRK